VQADNKSKAAKDNFVNDLILRRFDFIKIIVNFDGNWG